MADDSFVSLYRRFRPGRFSELVGQDHVVRALRSAVRDDRVSHAYLFSGPRGTGKTSSARILAKALNCEAPVDGEPCDVCTSCREITQGMSLNVHELDAASNNGVDSMRDLVAHAGLGTPGRWKVYIVDEVHMLSTAAANALLKTLEEPPGHVVFVLATTDPQKVPATIRSRTQHLEFRLLGAEVLQELLESVNASAALAADEATVAAALRRGRGSARDALSALDQLVASGSSDAARPELAPALDALSAGDASATLVAVSGLLAGGWGPQQLATELVDDLRQVFLAALAPELCAVAGPARERFSAMAESMGLPKVVRSMELLGTALVDMRDAPDPQVVLEIAVVRATRPDLDAGVEALNERVGALERQILSGLPPARAVPPETTAADVRRLATPTPVEPPPAAAAAPAAPPAEPEAPAEPGRRPSLGAVQRRAAAASGAEPAPAAESVAPVVAPATASDHAPGLPAPAMDRDSLTEAWGDVILKSLPALVKALFSAGRFVAVGPDAVQFALPTAPHRDRCLEEVGPVEKAISAHFGTSVTLELVVDASGPSPRSDVQESGSRDASRRGAPRAERPPVADPEPESVDPEDMVALNNGVDQEAEAEARLKEAFPGASEVTG
jgi:DNA polymerase-3 subunit gamma/tau